MTFTPIAERLALELSRPIFTTLGLSPLGFEYQTFRMWANALTDCATSADMTGAWKIHMKINGVVISTFLWSSKTPNNVRIYNSMSSCPKQLSSINLSWVGHSVVRSNGPVKLDIGSHQAQYCGYMYVAILQDEMLLETEICFYRIFEKKNYTAELV